MESYENANLEEPRRQLEEASARLQDPRENRKPYTKHEVKERSGWFQRIEELLEKTPKIPSACTSDGLARLPNINEQQGSWSFEHDPITDQSEIRLNPEGKWEFVFLRAWLCYLFDEETAEMIANLPMVATEALLIVYPFPQPSKYDHRHWPEEVKWLVAQGIPTGVLHLAFCRAKGCNKQKPALTNETFGSANKYDAVDQWFRTMAPYFQALGILYSVIDPVAYAESVAMVNHWCDVGNMGQIVKTERHAWCVAVLLQNRMVRCHTDNGDAEKLWTANAVSGTYGGSPGSGNTFMPAYEQGYHLTKYAILLFKASILTHGVKPYQTGERLSLILATPDNMRNLNDYEPSSSAATIRQQKAKVGKEETLCPMCLKIFMGNRGLMSHLSDQRKKIAAGTSSHSPQQVESVIQQMTEVANEKALEFQKARRVNQKTKAEATEESLGNPEVKHRGPKKYRARMQAEKYCQVLLDARKKHVPSTGKRKAQEMGTVDPAEKVEVIGHQEQLGRVGIVYVMTTGGRSI